MAEGVTFARRNGLGIASVMAWKDVHPEAIRVGLPSAPRATFDGARIMLGTGPGTWLFVEEDAGAEFAEDLAASLAGLASVSDQSSGYVVHRLSGPAARTLLQRGLAIDLHPDVFSVGTVATTMIAHMGVIVWQVDDCPTYDIATFRSYANSFRHWLAQGAAAL